MGFLGRPSFKRKKEAVEELNLLFTRSITGNLDKRSISPIITAFKKKHRIKNLEDILK